MRELGGGGGAEGDLRSLTHALDADAYACSNSVQMFRILFLNACVQPIDRMPERTDLLVRARTNTPWLAFWIVSRARQSQQNYRIHGFMSFIVLDAAGIRSDYAPRAACNVFWLPFLARSPPARTTDDYICGAVFDCVVLRVVRMCPTERAHTEPTHVLAVLCKQII